MSFWEFINSMSCHGKFFVIKLLKSKVTLDKANLKQNNESTTLISGSLILCRIV